jgi:hypothetical protein
MHCHGTAEYRGRCAHWIARGVMVGIAALLVIGSNPASALGDESARPSIHGWPTFAPTDSNRPMVMSPSVPPSPAMGARAPATAPLPPGVLTGGMLLGAQWIILRVRKTQRI